MSNNSIPQDVILMQQLLEEYGFDADNCDPVVINQLLAWVQQESATMLRKSSKLRQETASFPTLDQFRVAKKTHQQLHPFEFNPGLRDFSVEAIAQQQSKILSTQPHAQHRMK